MGRTTCRPPRISIVIPSFNQGCFLERCLHSIFDQGYQDLEVIVIDGGSSDETSGVLERNGRWLDYWVSEPDRGQSDALNKGFARATGDVLGWQNADDVYLKGAFAEVSTLFAERPELQVAYSNFYEIDEEDRILQRYFALPPASPLFAYATCDIATQALFWRRSAHEAFGAFDIGYQRCMDSQLKLDFLIRYRPPNILRCDAFWGAFRRHPAQKTDSRGPSALNIKEEADLAERFGFRDPGSLRSQLDRITYRVRQMGNALRRGGVVYTLQRLRTGVRRRGAYW